MKEIWKWVPGYQGKYEVSSMGRVRSYAKYSAGRLMNPCLDGNKRYLVVSLCGSPRKLYKVHTLVLWGFVGPRPAGMEGMHLNGDAFDNALTNLKWGTPTQNQADKIRHGRSTAGTKSPNAKLTEKQVMEIRRLAPTISHYTLAARFGVARQTITWIAKRKGWAHV